MKMLLTIAASALFAVSAQAQTARPVQTFPTSAGPVKITPVYHAAMVIEAGGKVIYVDPAKPADIKGLPPADLILITDIHGDHMDQNLVTAASKSGTVIWAPEAVAKTITTASVIKNGETKKWDKWTIEAVPMYNLTRGPGPGKFFHDKGRGNGYVLTYGGKRFYISGDTENIPEMRALKNIDVAFVCMNLPYTMTRGRSGRGRQSVQTQGGDPLPLPKPARDGCLGFPEGAAGHRHRSSDDRVVSQSVLASDSTLSSKAAPPDISSTRGCCFSWAPHVVIAVFPEIFAACITANRLTMICCIELAMAKQVDRKRRYPRNLPHVSIPVLQKAAKGCRACDLWKVGTQTVFGAGAADAKINVGRRAAGRSGRYRGETICWSCGQTPGYRDGGCRDGPQPRVCHQCRETLQVGASRQTPHSQKA